MLPDPIILMPDFVARFEGYDLRTMDAADEAKMRDIMTRYSVIIIAGQIISNDDQVAFAERFGPPESYAKAPKFYKDGGVPKLLDISNVDKERNILDPADKRRLIDLGNRLWHSDSSFNPVPAHHSMLYAIQLSSKGGETQFCDMRAAYDALPDDWKEEIKDLVAEHWAMHSRVTLMGVVADWSPAELEMLKPDAWHKLVRTLPDSGRKSLFLSAHASRIIGMALPEARILLHELTDFAAQPERIYTHHWEVGDLVIWDNRCTMHRLRRYDVANEKRILRRATTVDVAYQPLERPVGEAA
jgi:alpha-ketoglutarate-dependent 2,4-dichlorophenoxyacetate dioxygenase